MFSPAGAATPFPVDAAAFWRFFTGRPRFAFATGARLAFAVVFAADLSIRKLSRFFPAFTAAAIHLGIAPRPAQVSLRFLGLRYLGATFLPFSLLPAGRPSPAGMGRRKRSAFLPAASHSAREPAIARRVGWTDLPSDLPLCVWSVAPPVSETPGGAFVFSDRID